jgi:phosphatidylglycerol lysyltransferase
MDFLFVSLLFWGRDHGHSTFNLGLSPLYGVGTQERSSPMERFLHFIYEHANFYNFKGLNGFKAKFRPAWTPLYMVFPGYARLLPSGLALARANAGTDETLLSYFRSHPKQIQQQTHLSTIEAAEDLAPEVE